MPLIKGLYTALAIVTGVNAITSLFFFWPKVNKIAADEVDPKESDGVCTWKETLWLILMIIAVIFLVFIVIFSFSILKTRFLMTVVMISYFLQQMSRSISSAERVGDIVRGNANKILGANDYVSMITLALLVGYWNTYGFLDKIVEYADCQTNAILSDWILLGLYVVSIAITTFFICSLALMPLKLIVYLLKKVFSQFGNQKAFQSFEALKGQVNGRYSTKIMSSALIEHIIKQDRVISCILWLCVPVAIILDIFQMVVLLAYGFLVSIVWYLMYTAVSIGKIFSKIADWILSLSDRNVVAISFRISVILGFGCTVIINRYEPFLSNQESSSVFEFISSTIIIPVILEWILSYKAWIKNTD